MEFYFFQILLTCLSQNSDSQTQNYTPHHYKNTPTSMLSLHSLDDSQLWVKNVEKNQKIAKSVKFKNFKTPYKNLEKQGSFSEFRTSREKSVMLATLLLHTIRK